MMEKGDKFVLKHMEELDTENNEHLRHDAIRFETLGGVVLWIGFNHDGYCYLFVPEEK
jgi:hypothetical protein